MKSPPRTPRPSFRLYVAGGSPNAQRALENLRRLCTTAGHADYELQIVDVLREPRRALEEGVLVAPTLIKLAPAPIRRIVGDLSDQPAVSALLNLPELVE